MKKINIEKNISKLSDNEMYKISAGKLLEVDTNNLNKIENCSCSYSNSNTINNVNYVSSCSCYCKL